MTVQANWQMPLTAGNPDFRRKGSYDYAPTGRAARRAMAKQQRREQKRRQSK